MIGCCPVFSLIVNSGLLCAESYKPWSQAAPLPGPDIHLFLFTEGGKKPPSQYLLRISSLGCSKIYIFSLFTDVIHLQKFVLQVIVSLLFPEYLQTPESISLGQLCRHQVRCLVKRLILTLKPKVWVTRSMQGLLSVGSVVSHNLSASFNQNSGFSKFKFIEGLSEMM